MTMLSSTAALAFLWLTSSAIASEPPSEETARAEAYAVEACSCLLDNYDAVHQQSTGMQLCIDRANASHNIPAAPTETVTYELGGASMTLPKLFISDEANLAYATLQHACMLRFNTALLGFQSREWSEESICSTQCAAEGDLKKLCNSVCMDARLPDASAPAAPASCEEQCAHLDGRSKYACEQKCKQGQ